MDDNPLESVGGKAECLTLLPMIYIGINLYWNTLHNTRYGKMDV